MLLLQTKLKFVLLIEFICIFVFITGALVSGDSGCTMSKRYSDATKNDLERHKALSNIVDWSNTVSNVPKKRILTEEPPPDNDMDVGTQGDDDNVAMENRAPPSLSKIKGFIKVPLYSTWKLHSPLYAVDIGVGTPPRKVRMIVDTGSTLTWVKCAEAYPEEAVSFGQGFVPSQSSTYKILPCDSDICINDMQQLSGITQCPVATRPCLYDYIYGFDDETRAKGVFAMEMITLPSSTGSSIVLENVLIGCSHSFVGRANVSAADGILGLGLNPFSLSVRGVNTFGGAVQFCFVDHLSSPNKTSYLIFGSQREKAPAYGFMRYTPIRVSIEGNFLFVDIKGISLGSKMLNIPPTVWFPDNGGTIFDSGAPVTYLVGPAYRAVMDGLISLISKDHPKIADHNGDGVHDLEYCFDSILYPFKEPKNFPKLQIHFADGTRFTPHVTSYIFEEVKGFQCLGFLEVSGGMNIIGNLIQQNYIWEYDFDYGMLGFAPSTCE